MAKRQTKPTSGPEPERLRLNGPWEAAIDKALSMPKGDLPKGRAKNSATKKKSEKRAD